VPEAFEEAAHPRGVGADLEHGPRARVAGEVALEGRRRGAEPRGRHDATVGVEGAELGEAVAEIQADR
jgi:hypothetical protein